MSLISDNRKQLLVVDNSDDEDDLIHDGKRRGSNVSLSRFRSCPQLLDEAESQHTQRFEQTTDDNCTYIKPAHIFGQFSESRQFYEQNGRMGSNTPTPPSSPKSRRSLLSLKESQSGATHSQASTPRLLRRSYIQRTSLSIGSSTDSLNGSRNGSINLTEDNIRHHEICSDLSQMLVAHPDKKQEPKPTQLKHPHGQSKETQLKCEQWLQTLSVSKPDKIKSRSHIQLPPI